MKNEISITRHFGPTLLKVQLPQQIINDLNKDCEEISAGKHKKIDWSEHLAGKVKEEYLISDAVLAKHSRWFVEMAGRYAFPNEEDFKKAQHDHDIMFQSGWYVRQYANDFNPKHHHLNCTISCVGYLKMPEDIKEHWEEEEKDHNPAGGAIEFSYGVTGFNCPNNIGFKPAIGEFFMFPHFLDHQVYPFKSKYLFPDPKGERRSFSLNIMLQKRGHQEQLNARKNK